MARYCKDEDCNLPHYRIGKYRYCVKSSDISKPKQKPIKSISDKQSERLKTYRKVRDEYMFNHPICEFPNCTNRSTDLHHGAGRVGELLTDIRYFKALDREHHRIVEENPTLAQELGLSFKRLDK